jgi:hypothetical protein
MSPSDSDDLTYVIKMCRGEYIVLWSPETAEHDPDYRELGSFPSREQALAWLSIDGSDAEV